MRIKEECEEEGSGFPDAAWYRNLLQSDAAREPRGLEAPPGERLLQCAWYDPAWRPARLRTSEGEEVAVESPGAWNLEAGPDFLGAVLLVGPERRRLAGDVEIHVRPHDWMQHSHRDDPRYAQVRAHVTWLPGALPPGELPVGALEIALRDPLSADPSFSFENIDSSAYPYAARADAPPCAAVLTSWSPDAREHLLESAGQERLRRKAERLGAALREQDPGQTLYGELMRGLGYKHNKAPFRRLADLVPLAALRDFAEGDPVRAYALLAGVAGLLPENLGARWDDETRAFVRFLWDTWWKVRGRWADRGLARSAWRLAGLRPTNLPARRLMAAALWFTREPPLSDALDRLAASATDRLIEESLALLDVPGADTYWDRRLSWGGKRQTRPTALVGQTRALSLFINVVAPYQAACGEARLFDRDLLDRLPVEGDNALIRRMAHTLFGPDYAPSLIRSGIRRQGLIQIFHDFCVNDRSRCAGCSFPARLRKAL